MNSLDLFILIFVCYFLVRGIFRGFILELAMIAGVFAGYLVASTYQPLLSPHLESILSGVPQPAVSVISFALIFIVVNIGVRLLAGGITKTVKFAMLGWVNRLLGAVFGLLKGLLILSIAAFIIEMLPLSQIYLEKIGKNESVLYPVLQLVGPQLYAYIQSKTATFIN